MWGVDINPFAVAIARFRLIVAAVRACGIRRLKDAPAWNVHLATGDSLLFGSRPGYKGERLPLDRQGNLFEVDPIYAVEDPVALREILGQGYHVAVGNPPYITPKDKAQNEACRALYSTCHRQYSLGVPFTQRFWELAMQPDEDNGCGYIGQITTNSFMKREFGKKLIEDFFPKIDLTHVIDTSGAYIPGHGTPTVILFGRARKPIEKTVRAILGIKGETLAPDDPSQGLVWQSIVKNIDIAGSQDEFASTADLARETFARHPWSIGGGGVGDLKEALESGCEITLDSLVASVGFMCITKQDDVFPQPKSVLLRNRCELANLRSFGTGEQVRDWGQAEGDWVIFPYDDKIAVLDSSCLPRCLKFMWPYKPILWDRKLFGGNTYKQSGKNWYEYGQIPVDRMSTLLSIPFVFFATHNHCVVERGPRVFKHSIQLIKLPPHCDQEDHTDLAGLLNASTTCFWLKQTCHDKGGGGIGGGLATETWEHFYDFTATNLLRLPVPDRMPRSYACQLDALGQEHMELLPEATFSKRIYSSEERVSFRIQAKRTLRRMISIQEELDWECYRLYSLLSDDFSYTGDDLPELALGQRAFEIVMARQVEKGELQTTWFERHGSTPMTEIPTHWPAAYQTLVERRIKLIETNKEIGLIEKPEYKRRWNTEPWSEQEQRALKNWLLDRLEDKRYWPGVELQSTARLADLASTDAEFMQVAAIYRGRPDFDVAALVAELVGSESVPFLPILRYKATGLRKRIVWERTWDLQRQEDAGKDVGDIPVPPKYATSDFLKTDYWRLRGKLDVPKERWISYPHCQTDGDPSLLVGWAGWDHLQQVEALVGYYDARKREGWDARRLTPLLAGLDQLLPWVHQWHPEVVEEFGESAGKSYQTLLEQDAHELGLTLEDIRNWTPPEKARKTRAVRKKKGQTEDDE